MSWKPFGYGHWCHEPFRDDQRTVRWERKKDGSFTVRRYHLMGEGLYMGKCKVKI